MLPAILYHKTVPSPVGPLRLIASDRGLCAVLFNGGRTHKMQIQGRLELNDQHKLLLKAEKQLNEYFAGERQQFDLKLDMRGTVFQQKAWRVLQHIPYGKTISYGEQARQLGDAHKARAVGMADGMNPLCIVVPCHRVIGVSGSLTGFAGGLKTKEFLLGLEKKFAAAA